MDLKEHERFYIKLMQKQITEKLETGLIKDAPQQYAFIEELMQKLVLLNNKKINEKIGLYFEVQDTVKDKVKELQEKLQGLSDQYAKNVTKMYEEIKKL